MKMFKCRAKKIQRNEDDIRLERAEDDLRQLKQRGIVAIRSLEERDRRNHWRESIERMIQGV